MQANWSYKNTKYINCNVFPCSNNFNTLALFTENCISNKNSESPNSMNALVISPYFSCHKKSYSVKIFLLTDSFWQVVCCS